MNPICSACNRSFPSNTALQQHKRDSPAHTKSFDCKTCDRSFSSKEALDQHLQQPTIAPKSESATKKMSVNAQQCPKISRMFPALHKDVATAVYKHLPLIRFHESQSGEEPNNVCSTFVSGHFNCYNPYCKARNWSSGQITILIRGYPGLEYDAEVFGQRCKECKCLGKLVLNKKSYVERVSYRIMFWAGVQLERPPYVSRSTPPHEKQLCEGCKRGICRRSGE